jgi:hypothetical protein
MTAFAFQVPVLLLAGTLGPLSTIEAAPEICYRPDLQPYLYNTSFSKDCICYCKDVDPDCANLSAPVTCFPYAQPGNIPYTTDNHMVTCAEAGIVEGATTFKCERIDIPRAWTCDPQLYDAGDGVCDCGCGFMDPDCMISRGGELSGRNGTMCAG